MDLTSPIDITAVIGAVKEHRDLLVTLDALSAKEILQHFTPIPGVKDSITLGRTTLGKISHKYTGTFLGQINSGKIKPRTLKVYPCVMEMSDEPERYRRTYVTEVKGGLDPNKHPFEVWLNNYGIKCASAELHDAIMVAKYDDDPDKKNLSDSFDGPLTIIDADRSTDLDDSTHEISVNNGNLYVETSDYTAANIGDKLLLWWRSLPQTLRRQEVQLHMSVDMGDLYDDWLDAQGTLVTGSGAETANQQYLRNTNKKCKIVRMTGMPEGSQFMWITIKENQFYGYDAESDMSQILPFASGNPYMYTASGKYVLGFQFATFDKSLFSCNSKPIDPSNAGTTYNIQVAVASGQEAYGTVSGGNATAAEGASVTIKATPTEGYKFVKWDDNDTNAERTVTASADKTYTASFALDEE